MGYCANSVGEALCGRALTPEVRSNLSLPPSRVAASMPFFSAEEVTSAMMGAGASQELDTNNHPLMLC